MPLTINEDSISGDRTSHTARLVPGHPDAWEVSWLPGQLLSRNTAITAMILADTLSSRILDPRDRLWPHIKGWAAEIGLTTPDVLIGVSQPPDHSSAESDSPAQQDREAAG
jgi:hypothetical protein